MMNNAIGQVVEKLEEAKKALESALGILERIDFPEYEWIRTHIDSHHNDIDDTLDCLK